MTPTLRRRAFETIDALTAAADGLRALGLPSQEIDPILLWLARISALWTSDQSPRPEQVRDASRLLVACAIRLDALLDAKAGARC